MKGARIRCYLLEEIGQERVELSITARSDEKCPKRGGGSHRATITIARGKIGEHRNLVDFDKPEAWPASCACGYAFKPEDFRSGGYPQLYRRVDTGQVMTTDEAPAGAIWRSSHYETEWGADYRGTDGKSYVCKLPDGHTWLIDSRANNCTSPCRHCAQPYATHRDKKKNPKACDKYEDARPHKCWVRTGVAPALTASKGKPGESCKAGAGSILTPGYHGHLRNGELVSC